MLLSDNLLSAFYIRTKTLVLELLAAVCLVSGGHQMILLAFDNFKKVVYLIQVVLFLAKIKFH